MKKTLQDFGLMTNEILSLQGKKNKRNVLKNLRKGTIPDYQELNRYKKFVEFESKYC